MVALLLDDSLVLIMRTDPNPDEIHYVFDCQCPVIRPSPHDQSLPTF